MTNLGHELVGTGAIRVLIMNDWMCDTSTWDPARPYLDRERFTWAFTDLRGYGRSRRQSGEFNLREASRDVLALADALGWPRFAIVGHSMSTLIAAHLAQHHPNRIERVVLITPPPPRGFGGDEAAIEGARMLARADAETQLAIFKQRNDGRLTAAWSAFKAGRFRKTVDPEAAAAYVPMFVRDGLPDPTKKIAAPVLAITGEQDAPPMRSEAVTRNLAPFCEQLTVRPLADCGHYPMQESPPLLAAIVEDFLER